MTCGDAHGWRILGKSIRGAAHLRNGLPNQDSLRIRATAPWVLALADGHGSERCFRSDRGARYAAELALELGGTFDATLSPSILKDWVENDLPRQIVQRWCEKVDSHIAAKPFSKAQKKLLKLAETHPERARLAYGTTLLLVVVTQDFIFYLQLGDGDILTVSSAGEVSRALPKDGRLLGNETTSLCMAQAWREMRTVFQVLAHEPPALILAATDGYANSFRDEASFQRVGSDLLHLIRQDGLAVVEHNLEAWLNESSQIGSGDDISLGLLYRQGDANTQ